ncbi:lysine 2,3-aminomutase [Terrihabitans soli]|uniref:Lysine 2,3-aminomutase n=2 Tax=Terrihabitans soli TaxID=708113 RepID=A0A6S6QL95_9HYPH|nr:lysine 2,3-aminomutase [Terrihabitans soli]
MTLRTIPDLAKAELISASDAEALEEVAARYAVAIPPALAALIDKNDPNDPIALQFVPHADELETSPEERADPIGDLAHSPVEGIVHRYPDRVLLKPLHVCPVYCRFCFRREMVGPEGLGTLNAEKLDACFAYITAHPDIWEVILTGGDPLILAPRRLKHIVERIGAIDHVKIIRIHTRVPVADPDLIDEDLIAALKAASKPVYIGVHANHPRELSPAARTALKRLADAGLPLLSQTVLLRGVNDDPKVMAELMRSFVENRVRPYYLHHPDLAPGTARFRVTIDEGRALMRALRGHLSGLAMPTYVLDIPGGHGKSPVGPDYVHGAEVEDFRGARHSYPE